jgi:hypothetical protein
VNVGLLKFSNAWLASSVTTQGLVLGRGTAGSAVASSDVPIWYWLDWPAVFGVWEEIAGVTAAASRVNNTALADLMGESALCIGSSFLLGFWGEIRSGLLERDSVYTWGRSVENR